MATAMFDKLPKVPELAYFHSNLGSEPKNTSKDPLIEIQSLNFHNHNPSEASKRSTKIILSTTDFVYSF